MRHTQFLIALLLIASLTASAAAQSHSYSHPKKHKRVDSLVTKDSKQAKVKDQYTCTMHPEVISDKPGKCPKCGMTLVKVKPAADVEKSHKAHKDTSMVVPVK
jgi:hypothetical protein